MNVSMSLPLFLVGPLRSNPVSLRVLCRQENWLDRLSVATVGLLSHDRHNPAVFQSEPLPAPQVEGIPLTSHSHSAEQVQNDQNDQD
jgi:hypothetical protein